MSNSHERKAILYYCKNCGGTNILRDAWAEWDETAQEWALAFTCDSTADTCRDCGGIDCFEEQTIPPECPKPGCEGKGEPVTLYSPDGDSGECWQCSECGHRWPYGPKNLPTWQDICAA